MITTPVLLSVGTILFMYFLWMYRKYFILWWKIGGPNPIPFTIIMDMTKLDKMLYTPREYLPEDGKDWYRFAWLGPFPFVYVADAHIAQTVLNSPKCINKAIQYNTIDDSFGPGLFSIKNPEWSRTRKLINPVFAHKVLLSFFPIFNKEVDIFNKILDQYVNEEVELLPLITKCTFDIANQTTMGKELNIQTSQHSDEWEAFLFVSHVSMERMAKLWLFFKPFFNLTQMSITFEKKRVIIHNWIQKLIANKIESCRMNEKNLNSKYSGKLPSDVQLSTTESDLNISKAKNIFIDHVHELVMKKQFTWDEFEGHSKHILAAAFETTATTVSNIIILLAMYPECQERLFEEIYSVFPEKDFEVTYDQTRELPYLDMVINETFRVLPTVPAVGREVSEEFEIKKGVFVPKKTQILIDIFNLHKNPLFWGPNYMKFDPEHFAPENITNQHPYAFIPYLKGARNCIGHRYAQLSLKVIIPKILRNFKFATDFKFEDLHCIPSVSLKFKINPKIKVYRREK